MMKLKVILTSLAMVACLFIGRSLAMQHVDMIPQGDAPYTTVYSTFSTPGGGNVNLKLSSQPYTISGIGAGKSQVIQITFIYPDSVAGSSISVHEDGITTTTATFNGDVLFLPSSTSTGTVLVGGGENKMTLMAVGSTRILTVSYECPGPLTLSFFPGTSNTAVEFRWHRKITPY